MTAPTKGVTPEPDLDFDDDIALATGSSYPQQTDLVGCLLLMKPYANGTRRSKNADGKDYPWVECDAWVLELPIGKNGEPSWPTGFFEGEPVPYELEGFQFTGNNVVGTLMRQMRKDKLALGVLIIGEQKDRSKQAPWILEPPSEDQMRKANTFYKAYKARQAAKSDQEFFN